MVYYWVGGCMRLIVHGIVGLCALSVAVTPAWSIGTSAGTTSNPNLPVPPPPGINQTAAQAQQQDQAKKGQQQAQMMGLASIALGGYMVKTGISLNSTPCACGTPLIISGVLAIMQGIMGLNGAKELGKAAGAAGMNLGNLGSNGPTTTKLGNGSGSSTFSVDPAALRSGKVGEIMSKFEKATGASRDALAKALGSGMSPFDALSKMGISKSDLAKAQALANGAIAKNSNAVADNAKKLGLDKIGGGIKTVGDTSGASTNLNAAIKPGNGINLDDLAIKDDAAAAAAETLPVDTTVSADVQSELNREGITDMTIFQMVRTQYTKKTPMMFGQDDRAPASFTDIELPKGL